MKNDGGPDLTIRARDDGARLRSVFEVVISDSFWHKLYAGMAMQGLLAAQAGKECEDCASEEQIAAIAGSQADAMLAERDKPDGREAVGPDVEG